MDRVREVDLVDLLAGVETPTLVVTGSQDPVTPVAAAEEVVAALPPGRARLEVLRGAGHFPWLDRPRELRSILTGFLDASP
jgi:pimeloyl-ACP methyl ester carboxylesterase